MTSIIKKKLKNLTILGLSFMPTKNLLWNNNSVEEKKIKTMAPCEIPGAN